MTDVIWVAGARGGIGGACIARLEAVGATVVGTDLPDVDVTTPNGCALGVSRASAGGNQLAGAVHAVGMSGRRLGDGPVTVCSDEAWEEVLRVNLTSVFLFLRATLRSISDGGSVVVIGSALASTLDADFLTAAYRVAKAGLVPLVEAAAHEAAPRGVRVNVVAAGLVDTPMAARALSDERISARLPELMPLGGKAVSANEVAAAVEWLLSPASSRTTGTVIPVDGGWTLR
jgi:NAD(P)-dependent dehydrogenase (short-subunit alcohol dehydrogenase family)